MQFINQVHHPYKWLPRQQDNTPWSGTELQNQHQKNSTKFFNKGVKKWLQLKWQRTYKQLVYQSLQNEKLKTISENYMRYKLRVRVHLCQVEVQVQIQVQLLKCKSQYEHFFKVCRIMQNFEKYSKECVAGAFLQTALCNINSLTDDISPKQLKLFYV